VKYGQETQGAPAIGILVGIDLDGVVEISNAFPLPNSAQSQDAEDDKAARSAARYQASLLRSLKDVQRDDNLVGFYQASSLGAHLSSALIDGLVSQRERLRHGGIVVVHGMCTREAFLLVCLSSKRRFTKVAEQKFLQSLQALATVSRSP
jgi:translation initiation factor 3 subunit H